MSTTHEDLVDRVLAGLADVGAVPNHDPVRWDEFGRFSRLVHERFEVPATSLTPIMRRLFYAAGHATQASEVLAVGSYVGYAVAYLAGGAGAQRVTGIDPDADANDLARKNLGAILDHTTKDIIEGTAPDAIEHLQGRPDLILLDLDDAQLGKQGYTSALEALLDRASPGAVVVAHDVCVPRFANDIDLYHRFVRAHPRLAGPWPLAVDGCGASFVRFVE